MRWGAEMARKTGRRYDPSYREVVELRDGSHVELRLVVPSSRDLLAEGFSNLSERSRYLRFHATKDRLSPKELSYLTELDNERHLAIGAVGFDGGRERGLGVARFVRDEESSAAEAAITVADDVQGQGLGQILLERLVEAAVERGVRQFWFEVLGENTTMRRLLESVVDARRVSVSWRGSVGRFQVELPERVDEHGGSQGWIDKLEPLYRILRLFADRASSEPLRRR